MEGDLKPNRHLPAQINYRNTGSSCEICSKLTIKTPERRHVTFVNFENNSHLVLVFSIINFEHVIAGWEGIVSFYPKN